MLATRFPRLPGDIGNPDSFPFPVLYRTVASAPVGAVVRGDGPAPSVADDLVAAAQSLEAEGADLVATSCGFLGGLQDRLQSACGVPVLASALVQLPWLRTVFGRKAPIGVITFDARKLTPRHFGSDAGGPVVVEGLEQGRELFPAIVEDRLELDAGLAEEDALDAARRLVAQEPGVAALLLECTNLSPYRRSIVAATGLPVFDVMTAISMLADACAQGAPSP